LSEDLDAIFGDFRALMNARPDDQRGQPDDAWGEELRVVLELAKEASPGEYEERWLAYLDSFPQHLERPLWAVGDLDELEASLRLVPHGLFSVRIVARELSERELVPLMRSHHLLHAHTLHLEAARLDSGRLEPLIRSRYIRNLRVLRVPYNDLDDRFVEAIAECEELGHLEVLDLSRNRITDFGVAALLDAPHLTRLRHLDLRMNRVSGLGAEELGLGFEGEVLVDPYEDTWE